jgi:hypothetical protein
VKVLDVVERVVLVVLGAFVAIVVLDALLRVFGGRLDNPFVKFVFDTDDRVTPNVLDTLVVNQRFLQTTLFNLAFYGLLVFVARYGFRTARAIVGTARKQDKEHEETPPTT